MQISSGGSVVPVVQRVGNCGVVQQAQQLVCQGISLFITAVVSYNSRNVGFLQYFLCKSLLKLLRQCCLSLHTPKLPFTCVSYLTGVQNRGGGQGHFWKRKQLFLQDVLPYTITSHCWHIYEELQMSMYVCMYVE